jgi:ABC-type multidrug transport system permease subunit
MAVFLLILHFAVILFVVIGFLVALITNHRWFRLIHAGLLAFITLLMILRIPCPLTVLEEGATGESYEDSFLATWLNRIIYVEWFTPRSVFIIDMIFAALVFSSFWWRPLKKKEREEGKITSE